MNILTTLFPGFENVDYTERREIPDWKEIEVRPWDILSKNYPKNLVNQLNSINLDNEQKNRIYNNVLIDESGGKVHIHPSAKIGPFVKLDGPCYIGENVEIRQSAYIRKGSWICKGVIIGHCSEIKNSVMLPHSKAPHFNYVGDSIVGFGVNLGAGVKLSNVRHDRKKIILKLENGNIIKTDNNKIGALIGDNSGIGCNVVTNPGTIISSGKNIPPNETLSGWN